MRIQRRVVGVVAAERRHLQLFDFGFLEAFRFRAAVLKPDFHLFFVVEMEKNRVALVLSFLRF